LSENCRLGLILALVYQNVCQTGIHYWSSLLPSVLQDYNHHYSDHFLFFEDSFTRFNVKHAHEYIYMYIYILYYIICWKAGLLCQPGIHRVGSSTTDSPRRFPPDRRHRSRCPRLAQLGAAARGHRGVTAEAREVWPGDALTYGGCHRDGGTRVPRNHP
jgi:hypothetical protein